MGKHSEIQAAILIVLNSSFFEPFSWRAYAHMVDYLFRRVFDELNVIQIFTIITLHAKFGVLEGGKYANSYDKQRMSFPACLDLFWQASRLQHFLSWA